MKNKNKVIKILIYIVGMIILLLIAALLFPTWTPHIKGNNSISVLEHVEINGSSHEMMIRGNDRNNPVIVFVHGGPGCSDIPFAAEYEDLLETKFTVVNYDQRGSGKSYQLLGDYSNLTSDLLVDDLLDMTDFIAAHLGKEKVILVGHSFGTYIAMQAANKAPEKYEAYIGIGQIGDTTESEIDSLNYCIAEAQNAANPEDVLALDGLAEKIKNGDAFTPRSYVIKYGGDARLIDPSYFSDKGRILFSSEYNLFDLICRERGISCSQNMLLAGVLNNPLPAVVTELNLPCYFIMGKYDYMTSSNAAKNYLDRLEADKKEFVVFEQSAHYPHFEEKIKFNEWMCNTFLKDRSSELAVPAS